jgi:hypothetical protein
MAAFAAFSSASAALSIYDPGLVPEVIEVRQDATLPDGHSVIEETIAPTVTWRGQVVKPGQIIVKRSPLRPVETTEVIGDRHD